MIKSKGYATHEATAPLKPFSFERRELNDNDLLIDIEYCGVCHSDIHQARNEWGDSIYPMVPGHEIIGKVVKVGSRVKNFKPGDYTGVGCIVDSCRDCEFCHAGEEQFCNNGFVGTYNSYERDGKTPTYGGYSNNLVVREDFALRIASSLDPSRAAPLLCAGITTYSPLRHWKVGKGQKVGIVGLGGLGHMGVKFSHAFGAETYVFTTSPNKAEDARRLGADGVVISKDAEQMKQQRGTFDFILNTVAAPIDLNPYLSLLKPNGTMVMVGIPDQPLALNVADLVMKRRQLGGSLIGGIPQTQEMLDFCAEHKIHSDVEIIPIQNTNEAYERMLKGDVKYRFVIDMKSLNE